jgi:hypothetical protein
VAVDEHRRALHHRFERRRLAIAVLRQRGGYEDVGVDRNEELDANRVPWCTVLFNLRRPDMIYFEPSGGVPGIAGEAVIGVVVAGAPGLVMCSAVAPEVGVHAAALVVPIVMVVRVGVNERRAERTERHAGGKRESKHATTHSPHSSGNAKESQPGVRVHNSAQCGNLGC